LYVLAKIGGLMPKCSECEINDEDIVMKECRVCGNVFCEDCMYGDACDGCRADFDDGQRCPHERVGWEDE
jgi:hypothetical protein